MPEGQAAALWHGAVSLPPTPGHRLLVALDGTELVGLAASGPAERVDRRRPSSWRRCWSSRAGAGAATAPGCSPRASTTGAGTARAPRWRGSGSATRRPGLLDALRLGARRRGARRSTPAPGSAPGALPRGRWRRARDFDGLPRGGDRFYEGLVADNTKAYWTDHKALGHLRARPMEALLDELEPRVRAGKVFRPYRDVRFSKDKTPYKKRRGVATSTRRAGLLYVQLGADGLIVGSGYCTSRPTRARRLRAAIAEDRPAGRSVACSTGAPRAAGRGRAARAAAERRRLTHPRADLLRTSRSGPSAPRARRVDARSRGARVIAAAWRAVRPLDDWLAQQSGRHGRSEPARRSSRASVEVASRVARDVGALGRREHGGAELGGGCPAVPTSWGRPDVAAGGQGTPRRRVRP